MVALGGGHGLWASLSALRRVTSAITAVVTVADDGGSSGRLRRELGAVPPGDLRMALAALARDDEAGRSWAELMQHRFGGTGPLAGHSVGNLILTGLAETLGDQVAALDTAARMLGAVGRVLPASPIPLDIEAEVAGLDPRHPDRRGRVRGQVAVATTTGRVESVSLRPERPPACPAVLDAIGSADLILLGPGSWFTSVLPHLLIPDLAAALTESPARTVVALNLAPQPGETDGFSPSEHLRVLFDHAPELRVDAVIADVDAVADECDLKSTVARAGAALVLEPVAAGDGTPRHDPARFANTLRGVFEWLPRGGTTHGEAHLWR